MFFHSRTVVYNVLFALGQFTEGHVGAHAHLAAHIRHQRPHQRIPRHHCALVYGKAFIRHKAGHIHRAHYARAAAGAARALTVEGKLLRRGRKKAGAAFRAHKLLPGSHGKRRGKPVPVRAPVGRKARKHQPQAVQKLCAGAECAAYAGHAGPLVQRQSGGHIQHFVHLGLCGLRHAPARVGGERIQIPPRALGVHNAQRQR